MSIAPSIVEHDQIPSALALNATQFNLSRVLGPALAGVLASVGAVGCFALNGVSYLPFIWVALWILPRGKAPASMDDGSLLTGVRDIARMPHLRGALLTVLATSILCGPLIVFCPVLVKTALHRDIGDFSLSIGAFGLGGLVGAIALLGVDSTHDRRRLSSWFAGGYGLILVLAAVNPWFWGLPALLGLAGIAMTVSNTSANSLIQATTLPGLRGQTVSLFMLAVRGGVSVGSLLTGLSAHLLGVRYALLINGVLAVATQFAIGYRWLSSPSPE